MLKNQCSILNYIKEEPYVIKDNITNKYIGYSIDLLDKVAAICNFSYRIKLVKDGLHGSPLNDNSWTGIVRELMNKVKLNAVFEKFSFKI